MDIRKNIQNVPKELVFLQIAIFWSTVGKFFNKIWKIVYAYYFLSAIIK